MQSYASLFFNCDVIFDKLSKLGQISRIIPYYTEIKDSLYLVSFPSIFSKIGTKKDSLTLKS